MKILAWLFTFACLLILLVAWQIRDTTVYAAGFSEVKFKSIQVGMPRAEVIRILGEPLSIQHSPAHGDLPPSDLYFYSQLRNIKGEYVRHVIFNDVGLVRQINGGRLGHYLGVEGERPGSFLEWLEWYVF